MTLRIPRANSPLTLRPRENLEIDIKKPVDPQGLPWTIDRLYELFPVLKSLDDHPGGYLISIHFATEISDRAYVVEGGRVRYAGTMADLEKQPEIKQKYLMI